MIKEKITDEELIAKISDGDMSSFETVIERYETKLQRYVLRISNFSYEESEELLQEIFIKIWQNINSFSKDLKFSSWAYRIAHNETISHFRRNKSRGISEQVELTDELFIPEKIDFVRELDQKISAKKVHQIIHFLDEKSREILVLKFLEDKSYEEISDILKLPIGTISVRINRAKKQFRETAQRLNTQF